MRMMLFEDSILGRPGRGILGPNLMHARIIPAFGFSRAGANARKTAPSGAKIFKPSAPNLKP